MRFVITKLNKSKIFWVFQSETDGGVKKIHLKNLVLKKDKNGKTVISTKTSPKPKVQPKTKLTAPPLIPVPPETFYNGVKQKTRPSINQNGAANEKLDHTKDSSTNKLLPWQRDVLMNFYTKWVKYPSIEDKKKLAVQVNFFFVLI